MKLQQRQVVFVTFSMAGNKEVIDSLIIAHHYGFLSDVELLCLEQELTTNDQHQSNYPYRQYRPFNWDQYDEHTCKTVDKYPIISSTIVQLMFDDIKPDSDLGSVVRRLDSAIHWIAIFSTFVKLAVDRYNLILRFGIYKLKFLGSIVGSRSIISQLFG